MDKKTLRDVELKGKRVVMRVDFNVPMAKDGSGKITDDTRIVAALPSIKYVLEQGGSLVLMSHLGRPKGVKLGAAPNPDNAAFTLKPVAEALSEKLGLQVKFVPDCMAADDVVKALKPGEVALLENTRFYKSSPRRRPSLRRSAPRWRRSSPPTATSTATTRSARLTAPTPRPPSSPTTSSPPSRASFSRRRSSSSATR